MIRFESGRNGGMGLVEKKNGLHLTASKMQAVFGTRGLLFGV